MYCHRWDDDQIHCIGCGNVHPIHFVDDGPEVVNVQQCCAPCHAAWLAGSVGILAIDDMTP